MIHIKMWGTILIFPLCFSVFRVLRKKPNTSSFVSEHEDSIKVELSLYQKLCFHSSMLYLDNFLLKEFDTLISMHVMHHYKALMSTIQDQILVSFWLVSYMDCIVVYRTICMQVCAPTTKANKQFYNLFSYKIEFLLIF